MSLDVMVRCTCFERGRTRPHPHPKLVQYSKVYGPYLKASASSEEMDEHDEWYEHSCPHGGFAAGEFLGNISLVEYMRNEVARIARVTKQRFPILVRKVIYDGTHTGDYIPARQAPALLEEIRRVQRHTKDHGAREFLAKLARMCQVSIRTGNPIQF